MSVQRQIHVEANADFELWVRWTSETGVVYPLSAAKMQIRASETSPVLVEASVDDGRITLDPTEGWAVIVIPKSALAVLQDGLALYDVVVTRASDGRVNRLLEGDAIINVGVTHG